MQKSKLAILISIFGLYQPNLKAQKFDSFTKHLVVEKIIYHSGHCNGTCPAIDLEIDSNYDVFLKRDIWLGKGESDKFRSGSFKGKIDPHTYFNLVATLISSKYTELKFPANYCCDGAITTIIIYANGKRTKLSSMFPPKEAHKLIAVLDDLALKLNIPPTTEDLSIEQ
jgi:hypothetical protein